MRAFAFQLDIITSDVIFNHFHTKYSLIKVVLTIKLSIQRLILRNVCTCNTKIIIMHQGSARPDVRAFSQGKIQNERIVFYNN